MIYTTRYRTRLARLIRMSDDLAQAWFAGFAVNQHTWPAMARHCLVMHHSFLRRHLALLAAREVAMSAAAA